MKSNKESVFDFIKLHFTSGLANGLSTKHLSERFGMQRTNMSSVLNELVKEGYIRKSTGRPVLYYLESKEETKADCFKSLVGFDGSLKRPVQLAKAAVLYPEKSLNTLIIGANGTGKSYLPTIMHRFAIENSIIDEDVPIITFNAKGYTQDTQGAVDAIFGGDNTVGLIGKAEKGILLIDNAEHLNEISRNIVCSRISMDNNVEDYLKTMVIFACNNNNKTICDDYSSQVPIVIELPRLKDRPFDERMQLICKFFTLESARIKRTLKINAEVLRCLLLYDCELNVMQLKADIKIACANAYVREFGKTHDEFMIYIGDFEHHVRKGFLYYKEYRNEVEKIIPDDYSYTFSETTMEMCPIDRNKLMDVSMYDIIEKRAMELTSRGLSDNDINIVLSAEIENEFRKYEKSLLHEELNKEQLSKLVDKKVIYIVEDFLNKSEVILSREFSSSVFYGLCLHVNALVNNRNATNNITSEQISEILENYKKEYSLSLQLSKKIEEEFGFPIPLEEVILITMFICYRSPVSNVSKKPVVIFILHGSDVAKSLCEAIRQLTGLDNVFYFEVAFEQDAEYTYKTLKEYIQKINRGAGVVSIYDMDFIGSILNTIETELKIVIRQMPTSLTTLGLELARKTAIDENIHSVFNSVVKNTNLNKSKVIVTLCSTGEGGAQELKNYIRRYGQVDDMEIISLAMSDEDNLKYKLNNLMKVNVIHCIVGTFDPKLFGIPFIPISDVLSAPKEELPYIIRLKQIKKAEIDFEEVYEYLDEQLKYADIAKLKRTLPSIIDKINTDVAQMSLDTEIGLFIHIACCVNRILSGEQALMNQKKDSIISKYDKQYKQLIKIIKPIEKAFSIIINDDEVANILTIINKI